jgi:RNA polymerase sigma factor (sigma-70 family)
MPQLNTPDRFEQTVLPHLGAAYNLAKWLTQNVHDADDVVQESCLRAFQFFSGYRGGDSRAWFLRIVRNTCYTWIRKNRPTELSFSIDDKTIEIASTERTPEEAALRKVDSALLAKAIDNLPAEFRETLILRDLEGLSYKEIADVIEAPLGTVMSRLARARRRVVETLNGGKETDHEL